ncbi:hypothetical protein BT69DRAFT_1328100 [Atractiella rhizophila]|nr:hypothetical protein BT69DRAFT_1328100 [Atractiella rhizophila]
MSTDPAPTTTEFIEPVGKTINPKPKAKSAFRKDNSRHYKLIHRSQRDPLLNDPDYGERVFEEIERKKRGKELEKGEEGELDDFEFEIEDEEEEKVASTSASKAQHQAGQAPLYGINFDDRYYDYTKHLRTIGESNGGVFLAAPNDSAASSKPKGDIEVIDSLPQDVIAPQNLGGMKEYRAWLEKQAEKGEKRLDPDMDFDLREVLEALDDEAYVEKTETVALPKEKKEAGVREEDEGDDDDFFGELLEGGEEKDASRREVFGRPEETAWEKEIGAFKTGSKKVEFGSEYDIEEYEEMDELGSLPDYGAHGGSKKEWMKAESAMSGMSAASKFRSEGLRDLDERFEQIQKQYEDEDSELEEEDDSFPEGPRNEVLDEFLNQYELLGSHVRTMMDGETGLDKLGTLRRELLLDQDGKKDVLERAAQIMAGNGWQEKLQEMTIIGIGPQEEKWDVESILTTKTNLENHPKILRLKKQVKARNAVNANGEVRITLDKRGMPLVSRPPPIVEDAESPHSDDEDSSFPSHTTITRARDETAEEKKARKQAVKEERKGRREEKKHNKEQFGKERGKVIKELQKEKEARGVDKSVKTVRL